MSSTIGRTTRQIKGPSAVGSNARHFWNLTWTLAVTDYRLKFFDSTLGYLWTLMRPLLFFGVLLLLFTQVLNLAVGVVLYPQALLLGMVFFNLFSEATGMSVRSPVDRAHIVRKVDFTRLAVPLAAVLQALFNFGMTFVVVVIFLLAAGGEVRWSWLELLYLVPLLVLYTSGLCMLLSILYVRARDVQPIWEVMTLSLFYLSPIFYTVEFVRAQYDASAVEWLIMLNPFAAILQQARHVMIDPSHPSAADAAGGAVNLLVPLAIGFVLFVLGAQLFRKRASRIAEEL